MTTDRIIINIRRYLANEARHKAAQKVSAARKRHGKTKGARAALKHATHEALKAEVGNG